MRDKWIVHRQQVEHRRIEFITIKNLVHISIENCQFRSEMHRIDSQADFEIVKISEYSSKTETNQLSK